MGRCLNRESLMTSWAGWPGGETVVEVTDAVLVRLFGGNVRALVCVGMTWECGGWFDGGVVGGEMAWIWI